jgi:hypothetical protein
MGTVGDEMEFIPILEAEEAVQAEVRNLRNSQGVRQHMYTDHMICEEEHRGWLASLRGDDQRLVMVVMFRKDLIGVVSLDRINRLQRTADWAFYIRDDLRGSGIG